MKSTDSLTGSMPCTPPSKTININRENRAVTKEKMWSSAASGQTDPPEKLRVARSWGCLWTRRWASSRRTGLSFNLLLWGLAHERISASIFAYL